MKITVIGWYGTETIGDRAILAGLISFFNKSFSQFELKLGSLYPFFSDRTINEDHSFYKELTKKKCNIEIFNSKDSCSLLNAIKTSDFLVMGGGPLMDLNELFMVEYAFKKAKKFGIKTALLGCGIGPLFNKKYRKSVFEISLNSDIHILRDRQSKENLTDIYHEFGKKIGKSSIHTSYDPAVECVNEYIQHSNEKRLEYIAINLREFPQEYSQGNRSEGINEGLREFIKDIAEEFLEKEIKLIPMHYFHIGGDDRVFLNNIALELNLENICVQNKNLNLKETIDVYSKAYFNIGMRFHSVVLQTIASGRNYVLDYTEPNKGKINGFLKDIDKNGFYDNRYISLQEDKIRMDIINNLDDTFVLNNNDIRKTLAIYTELLSRLGK
ncbi:MAG: polysaccharide pyruvyl transferase family protein [Methylomarinum sp.]|nr:polysaccharide pyruvyl transferase family protein [Methylomarinum sp.]